MIPNTSQGLAREVTLPTFEWELVNVAVRWAKARVSKALMPAKMSKRGEVLVADDSPFLHREVIDLVIFFQMFN